MKNIDGKVFDIFGVLLKLKIQKLYHYHHSFKIKCFKKWMLYI